VGERNCPVGIEKIGVVKFLGYLVLAEVEGWHGVVLVDRPARLLFYGGHLKAKEAGLAGSRLGGGAAVVALKPVFLYF
jgi:hypothetical protein